MCSTWHDLGTCFEMLAQWQHLPRGSKRKSEQVASSTARHNMAANQAEQVKDIQNGQLIPNDGKQGGKTAKHASENIMCTAVPGLSPLAGQTCGQERRGAQVPPEQPDDSVGGSAGAAGCRQGRTWCALHGTATAWPFPHLQSSAQPQDQSPCGGDQHCCCMTGEWHCSCRCLQYGTGLIW